MKDPLGVSPSKGNQGTTRGKEKFLLTSVGIEPTTSGLDLSDCLLDRTNSGKTQFLVNQLCGPFNDKFDYIVLICPTFAYNRTLNRFGERDPRLYVIICEQHQVKIWLKLASLAFEGTNTLIVLDDCAASKDVKGRTGELVKLGFSARHAGISVWVLTQQLSSIAKPFRENVAAILFF